MKNKIKTIWNENKKSIIKNTIIIIITILLFTIELPYVVYRPGGLVPLSKRIDVANKYTSDGELYMTYVGMYKGNIPYILLSYVIPNWDLVDSSEATYDGDSVDVSIKKDKILTEESIDNAIISTYTLLDKKINITKYHNHIILLTDESDTDMMDFDEIISVNGIDVTSLDNLKDIISEYKEGDILNVKVLRKNKEVDTTAKVYLIDDEPKIGVYIITTYDFDIDPKIDIKSKGNESGPSGGLMTSLAIYNSLTKDDITKGLKVSGTGTITADGVVGEISGVKYKVLGAIKKKADVFLCPKENYQEALSVAKNKKSKIKIIEVDTLEDAINKLDEL